MQVSDLRLSAGRSEQTRSNVHSNLAASRHSKTTETAAVVRTQRTRHHVSLLRSIVMSTSVCVCVCLSARISPEPHDMLYTSCFVDGIMFL